LITFALNTASKVYVHFDTSTWHLVNPKPVAQWSQILTEFKLALKMRLPILVEL